MAKARGFRTATQDARGNWWADETDEDGNVTGRVLVEPTGGGEDNEGNPILPYRAVVSGGRGDDDQHMESRIKEREMLGYSPQIAEQFAANLPAGFAGDAKNLAVGEQLTPAQVSSVITQLNQPGAYEGVTGMTADQYFADPRAAIQADNGQFTYRPDLMQGDFKSVDQETLMQQLGALPFVLSAFAAPIAASMMGASAIAGATGGATTGLESFLNTVPTQFGTELAPSLLNTGTLTTTPVNALSGLGSVLPAGGVEALMAGAPLATTVAGMPLTLAPTGEVLTTQIGGLAPELSTLTPTNTIPSTGSFTQNIDIPAQQNPFIQDATPTLESMAQQNPFIQDATPTLESMAQQPTTAPATTPTVTPPTTPSITEMIQQVTQNPLYQAAGAASGVASVLNSGGGAAPVTFTDLINGGVPSITDSINAATTGSGVTMPTLGQTGGSLGLPPGGLDAIMSNTPYTMNNPVSGLPTTMYPDGSSSVQQTGGVAPNLTTNTPTTSVTPPVTPSVPSASNAAALSKLLKDQFGIDIDPSTLGLTGDALSGLLGLYGANQQSKSAENLYNQQLALGAPYRAELANLNSNPSSFYSSPMFQGALQQGSDAMARSLSAKVGNPILNPTALQSMQDYTTRGSLDAFNQRFNQLSSAGQLGLGAVPSLGTNAISAQGGVANALGAGIGSLTDNTPDYTAQLMNLLRNRNSLGGYSLA